MIKLCFLGTGAAVPSPERGLSCTMFLDTDTNRILMIDCGGGSGKAFWKYRQYYDAEMTIIVTHVHPDHMIGILELLPILYVLGRKKPVTIYAQHGDNNTAYTFLDVVIGNSGIYQNYPFPIEVKKITIADPESRVFPDSSTFRMKFVDQIHSVETLGVKIRLAGLWNDKLMDIGFSSDSRPTNKEFFKDCSYLIHEATFPHTEVEEAIAHKHSTIKEAIDFCIECDADYIVLNHLNQNYTHKQLKRMMEEHYTPYTHIDDNKPRVAYDGMEIGLGWSDAVEFVEKTPE